MKIKSAKFWLVVALILCLISMVGASAIQTGGGTVKVQKLEWVGEAGYTVGAKLYKPNTATAENPAPAVVCVHGWWNNREMQDLYSTELARRGFVVIAPDMYGHGDSEWLSWDELYVDGCGEYSAVRLLADLPYVDSTRIGVTGHSSGGGMMNQAMAIDNEQDTQLIAACLNQAAYLGDDTGVDQSGSVGSRDYGIIASQYDEFSMYTFQTTDADGVLHPGSEFIGSDNAKNFLNFNEGAEGFDGVPVAGQMYTKEFDGDTAYRVVYTPAITHATVVFSSECVADAVTFFDTALSAPNPIPASSQVWQLKTAFNALGLIGFFTCLVAFPLSMLNTGYFSSLKSGEAITAVPVEKKGKVWFWGALILCAVFSPLSYYWIVGSLTTKPTLVSFFPQTSSLAIGLWAAACGLLSILVMLAYYFTYGKKSGISFADRGLAVSKKNIVKTILLPLATLCFAFGILWFADYFFLTDFRFFTISLRVFKSDLALLVLHFVPLFLVFYVVNSISVNCFNYIEMGKSKWLNILVLAVFNVIGLFVYYCIQYSVMKSSGFLAFGDTVGQMISGIWAFPTMVYLFVTPFMARLIYKQTKNPYIAGIINAFVITIMTVGQSVTIPL